MKFSISKNKNFTVKDWVMPSVAGNTGYGCYISMLIMFCDRFNLHGFLLWNILFTGETIKDLLGRKPFSQCLMHKFWTFLVLLVFAFLFSNTCRPKIDAFIKSVSSTYFLMLLIKNNKLRRRTILYLLSFQKIYTSLSPRLRHRNVNHCH